MIFGIARELIPALIRWRGFDLEARKYEDNETKEARKALTEALQLQINELKGDLKVVRVELNEALLHNARCDADRERLQGQVNVMQVQLDRIMSHEQKGLQHVEGLAQEVKKLEEKVSTKLT